MGGRNLSLDLHLLSPSEFFSRKLDQKWHRIQGSLIQYINLLHDNACLINYFILQLYSPHFSLPHQGLGWEETQTSRLSIPGLPMLTTACPRSVAGWAILFCAQTFCSLIPQLPRSPPDDPAPPRSPRHTGTLVPAELWGCGHVPNISTR